MSPGVGTRFIASAKYKGKNKGTGEFFYPGTVGLDGA